MKLAIGALLESAAGPLAKRVVSALGLGIISYAGVSIALEAAISAAQGYYNGMPQYVAAFFGLAGVGQGLGMIAGAMVFRATFASMPKLGALKK